MTILEWVMVFFIGLGMAFAAVPITMIVIQVCLILEDSWDRWKDNKMERLKKKLGTRDMAERYDWRNRR